MVDPVALTQALVRCPSVTPVEGGALVMLENLLRQHGFECHRVDRNGTPNLFARYGRRGVPTLGFNGHTDVVPPGDVTKWAEPPFAGSIRDGKLWGRGAADMKSGVAAWVAAACDWADTHPDPEGALILTITGDEEGDATDGTTALLAWMAQQGERMDACIVGEPTCPNVMGEMMKIGRRGSITFHLHALGVQGHAAYPQRARNPLPVLVRLLDRLASHSLDQGSALFDPSTLALTTIDVGNPANNVIPAEARATLNIRFNDLHSADSLTRWVESEIARAVGNSGVEIRMTAQCSGESFVTQPGFLSDLVSRVVEQETGVRPVLSTSGGTSDARFIKAHCPVIEFGLVGATMHKTDEHVAVADIQALHRIYAALIEGFFADARDMDGSARDAA